MLVTSNIWARLKESIVALQIIDLGTGHISGDNMFFVVTTKMTKQLIIRYYNIIIFVMKTTIMFFTSFKNMISVTITVAMTIVMLIPDHGNEKLSVTINKQQSIMSMLKRHITN